MDALENAGRRTSSEYSGSTMYTTLSPCAMCAGAIVLYRIPRVIIGENNSFAGEEDWLRNRGVSVTVLGSDQCSELMHEFIGQHQALWAEDIGEDAAGLSAQVASVASPREST
jgi:cytosine/creatinine deaminase